MAQAIVVGGGLAGVSAANTVLECGGRVVLVDKSAFCGGNSTKATSGINGAETQTQKAKKAQGLVLVMSEGCYMLVCIYIYSYIYIYILYVYISVCVCACVYI